MWIESHESVRNHPKTRHLSRALGVGIPQVIGHLHLLWWWCLQYARDGDLTDYDAGDIADGAEWDGDADTFVEALLTAGGRKKGWLERTEDGRLVVHDWDTHARRVMEIQARADLDARRRNLPGEIRRLVKEQSADICGICGSSVDWGNRKGDEGGTYTWKAVTGGNTVENVMVAHRGCAKAHEASQAAPRAERGSSTETPRISTDDPRSAAVDSRLTRPNLTVKSSRPTRTRRTYEKDSDAYRIAEQLAEHVRGVSPGWKSDEKTLQSWADTLRLMVERDGRTWDGIRGMIAWVHDDAFWSTNILSADKLRTQWTQLAAKAAQPKPTARSSPATPQQTGSLPYYEDKGAKRRDQPA